MRLNSKRMMKYSDEELELIAKRLAKKFKRYEERCREMDNMKTGDIDLKEYFSLHSKRRQCKDNGIAAMSELKKRGKKWWD